MGEDLEKISAKRNNFIIFASVVFWFIALLYGTGFGAMLGLYEKTIIVLCLCMAYQMIVKKQFKGVKKATVLFAFVILVQNLYTNIVYGENFLYYAAMYIIPILYSLYTVDEKQMRTIGMIYGCGGGAVLVVANFTNYFSGWDGNSVSLICFFSYAAFIASLFDVKKKEHQHRIIAYSCIYFMLLLTLNSRSCILFSMFLLLCELGVLNVKNVVNRNRIMFFLVLPLIIAILIVAIKDMPFISIVNEWSKEHFNGKSIFSGRDELWSRGVEIWKKHPIFGTGTFSSNWHNSAVAAITGAGTVGYFIWVYMINSVLQNACNHIDDDIIVGTVVAFLVVWLQQAVEQGLIGTRGNPLIFVLLGLILARTNTLEKEDNLKIADGEADGEQVDV